MEFSEKNQKKVQELLKRYPEGALGKKATLLPVLRLAQEQFGHISSEVMNLVAATLEIPNTHVYGVTSFYTQFHQKPVGKFHVQVCTNLSCCMDGAEEIYSHIKKRLGIGPGEITKDNRFSLQEVECLAACGTGPVIQVNNDKYCEKMKTIEMVDDLLETLK